MGAGPISSVRTPDELDELIRRSVQLDREAFGLVYEEFFPQIHRFIQYRIGGNRHIAEDLASHVFMLALRAIGKYRHRSVAGFRAWIFRIARNAIADHFRRNQDVAYDIESHARHLVDESDDYERIADSDILRRALEVLTPEQAEVIALRFSQDLSHREIAAIVGKKENAVRALQFRAIATLRRRFEELDP